MNDELESFIEAGKIAEKVLREIPHLVYDGQSLLDIAGTIEKIIIDNGAIPGFPVNLSVNQYAAHYTPSLDEKTVLNSEDVIKIDFGVSINGCVADQATTVDLSGKHELQVKAVRNALSSAVENIKPGAKVEEISKHIEDEIVKLGFKPISNLGGHMIKPYLLHAGIFIPNISNSNDPSSEYVFKEGDVFAIEPFATSGETGKVADTDKVEIFSLKQVRNVRLNASRKILAHILQKYSTLPFARRWLQQDFKSKVIVNAGLRELVRNDVLFKYPVLKDVDNQIITQAEVTSIVEKDGAKPIVPISLV